MFIQGASVAGPCVVSATGDQGENEGEESGGCSDRVQHWQTQGYTVQKTTAQLETVDSEDDVEPAPRGPNKVLKCRSADTVS